MEMKLDESVRLRTLLRLWAVAALTGLAVTLVGALVTLINYISDESGGGSYGYDGYSSGDPGSGLVQGLLVSYGIGLIVFLAVLLLYRLDEPISEWKTLLDGRSAAADSAYAAIWGTLAHRRVPVSAVPSRIRSDIIGREIVNNRLVVSSGRYSAFVSVFAYGTGLYVGWTMWRSRRGAVLIGVFLKDLLGALVGRSDTVRQMLRTERARAMREAVHSATREGVETVVNGLEVSIASAFGQELPVQDLSAPTQPAQPLPPMPLPPQPPAPPVPPTGSGS
ncbi:hypothetical protein BIV57_03875 [Mangrovactinospora gilvigrisea]|uniref:Uncharacterized protein n=1 Tax=Mangrovactinospora gilvigrisea TaxID=1428644 RepID=A0A1J7CGU3_9ACTN|nr:hypothetical protein [Mangrovactinospora gilvigrisea]OIV38882.1 hypothetical protein BIV57_03875 [Mangrovactinospora gilvigrisea]